MAVAYVDSGINSAVGPDTDMPDASATGAGGANDVLIGAAGWLDATEAVTVTGRVGGSATGVTQIGATFSVASGALRMALFIKKNPGSGALAFDAQLSSACENLFTVAAIYSGVDQTSSTGSLTTNSGNSTAPSVSPTDFAANGMLVAFTQSFIQTLTVNEGTEREQTWNAGAEKTACWSDRATTGALSWTQSSGIWGAIGVALLPAAAGGTSWGPLLGGQTHRLVQG